MGLGNQVAGIRICGCRGRGFEGRRRRGAYAAGGQVAYINGGRGSPGGVWSWFWVDPGLGGRLIFILTGLGMRDNLRG